MQKISIIIPVYNVEKYIRKCVDSILSQTYKNLEIILVDDGSLDNCGKICDQYAKIDNRVVVIHKQNGGLSSARNAGLKQATGDYIMFVDSDDSLEKIACESLINITNKTDADIICFNCSNVYLNETIDNSKNSYCYSNTHKYYELSYAEAIIDNIYRKHIRYEAWSKIYKKYIFDTIKFKEGLLAEDFNVFYKFLKIAKKIIYFDANLYLYLRRDDSIMGKKNTKLYYDIFETEKDFYPETHSVCKTKEDKQMAENRFFKSIFKIYTNIIVRENYDQTIVNEIENYLNNFKFNQLYLKNRVILLVYRINKTLAINLAKRYV